VLKGTGKGVMKETPQVFAQELNESEQFDEVSKSIQAVQKPE